MSFTNYFLSGITRNYFLDPKDSRYTERRERVYTFLKQPIEIEKMMFYGNFLCLDVFLHMFTFLPLRFLIALAKFLFSPFSYCIRGLWLDPSQKGDLLKGFIFLVVSWLLSYIDISMIYHLVRAQTLIKLYILYNMIEVADRLFSSFGQDILDALFWTATSKENEHIRVLLHTILAIFYVYVHALLVLFQATSINVAINSHNKVLLTVMMANNFVEIKGTVFKKYDKNNLFQISCSDVRERFHYYILILIVLMRNMQQYMWSHEQFVELLPTIAMVLISEVLVDWFKHVFVVKFNHIPIQSYNEYRTTLAYDLVSSHKKDSISDHCDVISRRMGFIPLPMAVLVFHITRISIDFNGTTGFIIISLGWILLLMTKLLNGIVLLGQACNYITKDEEEIANKTVKIVKSEHTVVDPFEHRKPNAVIIAQPETIKSISVVKRSNTAGDGASVLIKSVEQDTNPLRQRHRLITPTCDMDINVETSPAKARSMRPPSVDHTILPSGLISPTAETKDIATVVSDINLSTNTLLTSDSYK